MKEFKTGVVYALSFLLVNSVVVLAVMAIMGFVFVNYLDVIFGMML